jgi:hypothetical protein
VVAAIKGLSQTMHLRRAARMGNKRMTKLIQICASENDLFGLDADGVVYHYNFNTNGWLRLGSGEPGATEVTEGQTNGLGRPKAERASRGSA